MNRQVFFRASAAKQVEEAHSWWRENRPAAPLALREELARILPLVALQPGIGAPATNARLSGVRRLLLSKVGYWLYYRDDSARIDVLAFWHTQRGRGPTLR